MPLISLLAQCDPNLRLGAWPAEPLLGAGWWRPRLDGLQGVWSQRVGTHREFHKIKRSCLFS